MPEELKIDLSHKLRKIQIFTKRLVLTKLVGNYKTKIRGHGLEFNGFREYNLSDDANLIDWKVSARLNKPVIKEFVEERNLEVFLLIDVSSSMVFGSTEKLKNEYVAELASVLSYAILNVGDSLGYGIFSDNISNVVKPKVNKNLFYQLSALLINPEIYGGSYDLEKALKKCGQVLSKNSIIIIISDFIGLSGQWHEQLKRASYKFDIIGIMVRDPRDQEIPEDSDMIMIADPFTNKQIVLDPNQATREKYKKFVEREEKEITEFFSGAKADLLKLTTDKPFIQPLISFFKKRRRR